MGERFLLKCPETDISAYPVDMLRQYHSAYAVSSIQRQFGRRNAAMNIIGKMAWILTLN